MTTALLVIDVQSELFKKSTPIYQAVKLLQNINMLIDRARHAGVPVIFVQHSSEKYLVKGSEGWQLHPDLLLAPEDPVIHKHHPNAFEDTNLRKELEQRKVNTLVLTGMVTHGCVRATCLGALEKGYSVVLVSDAHSSYSKDAPQLIEKWNEELCKRGAEVITAQSVKFNIF